MDLLAFLRYFGIFTLLFSVPLNSTVIPILNFKIENYKRSSLKLIHHLFSEYGVVNCSFSFNDFLSFSYLHKHISSLIMCVINTKTHLGGQLDLQYSTQTLAEILLVA